MNKKALRFSFYALLGLAFFAFAKPAWSFSLMTNSSGRYVYWPHSEMPVPYYIQSVPSAIRDGSAAKAIMEAFIEWERPYCSYLSFEHAHNRGDTGREICGGIRNSLAWVEEDWPAELGAVVVAITMTCFEPGGGILGARVLFNGQDHRWATDGRDDAIDVRNVATHEIGHFIGIGHSDIPGTTMWPTTSRGDTSQRELHRDDLEAVCFLYPNPQPWSPSNSSSLIEGARETAERLGVDKAGGCDAESASALWALAIVFFLGGVIAIRWHRFR